MNLEELRAKIDGIDDTLVQAFLQRMEVVAQVAQEKKAQGLPTPGPRPGGRSWRTLPPNSPGTGAVRLCPVVHAL